MKLATLFILLILSQLHSFAGGTGENVLLVVNADSVDSKTIANHYAKLRSIPREQIVYISGVDPKETFYMAEQFRAKILIPLFAHMKQWNQEKHIDYIIYSTGFPYQIKCHKDPPPKDKKLSRIQSPITSLTSATFYAEMVLKKEVDYVLSGANPYYNISENIQGFSSLPAKPSANGANGANGRRYYLSFMLGGIAQRGSTVKQILTYLQASKEADFSQPKGTFYFTKTGDVRSRCRQAQFAPAIQKLQNLGYKGEIVETAIPMGKDDVIGVTTGTASFDWSKSNSSIKHGSIGDNLTSYGGVYTGKSGQTPCIQFLNHGAAAACGTVIEPYAIAAKFPNAMMYVHYVKGVNAAEAMYASVRDPFQLLMVGDALCQPFPKKLTITVKKEIISSNGSKKVAYTPTTNLPVSHYEIFIDGVFVKKVKNQFLLGINDVSPGAHELRIVAVSEHAAATRASYSKRIFLKRNMPHVKLSVRKNKVKLSDTISIKVYSPNGGTVSVYHNTQLLGTTKSGTIKVKAEALGIGETELYGMLEKGGKKIRTKAIQLEVTK